MQDLQEVTQEIHYENFRSEKLAIAGGTPHQRKIRSVSIATHWSTEHFMVMGYHWVFW